MRPNSSYKRAGGECGDPGDECLDPSEQALGTRLAIGWRHETDGNARARHGQPVVEGMHHRHREHRSTRRQDPVQEHEGRATQQSERSKPVRPHPLGQAAAVRAEHDQREREERDAEVRDPVRRVQIAQHEHPERIEGADHQEDSGADHHRGHVRPRPQQVEREPGRRRGVVNGLLHVGSGDDRQAQDGRDGDHEERRRDAERADEDGSHGRAHGEPEDLGRQQQAEVRAELVWRREDHDAADGGLGHPRADAHHQPGQDERQERGAHRHADEAHHVEQHAEVDEPAGMASIGERRQQDLGEERREESGGDDRAERSRADAELVAKVVEHREHDAVAGGEQRGQEAEREDEPATAHGPRRYQRS